MKLVIGIPVVGNKEIFEQTLPVTLSNLSAPKSVKFVIIDNNSSEPYSITKRPDDIDIEVIHNKKNVGYFYPLLQLYKKYDADLIGLMHYDATILTKGWDIKVKEAFADKKLGLVSTFGWQGVTAQGKDILPVGNSDSESQRIYPSKRITKLAPVVTVDSLFMAFRRNVIPLLGIDENILLKHFYDKIWPLRLHEKGYRSAAVGLDFRHFSDNKVKDIEVARKAQDWFNARWGTNIPIDMVDDMAYFEGMIRLVVEYRDIKKIIPCTIDSKYNYKKNDKRNKTISS